MWNRTDDDKKKYTLTVVLLACSSLAAAQQPASSPLGFTSSNKSLQQSFEWAKKQALTYSRSGAENTGPWYEAALPGRRNAFCMRDVSHQTKGAAVLGLYAANRNMLCRFAQSAAKVRDWAAYWENDGNGRPSPADYDFWFNLPANLDVLDATVRMWRWTGDDTYRDDPAFHRFFRITMGDYISAWQLTPKTILKRPRIANQHQTEGCSFTPVASRAIARVRTTSSSARTCWRRSTEPFGRSRRLQRTRATRPLA
jgi:hypothetical protein